ncbi:hypothetical protein LOK49_LG11G01119 [Camellia lanceoleosa]|uniref:Uncharacterized protein n=1 Tax=Camellia lanceoleosa TaxID=1840588 RepID=A0ACC0G138_9ERIC|nr:hypothetical protein LOK49_LG11G01119 [Camellia lanceoleosa]
MFWEKIVDRGISFKFIDTKFVAFLLWHTEGSSPCLKVMAPESRLNCFSLCLQQAYASFPFIRVPKVLQHLSRRRVLTMEWMVGDSPRDLIDISATESIDHGSSYSKRQQIDAKRRLLDSF